MFPHNREVPEELFRELSGIIVYLGVGTSGQGLDVLRLTDGPDCMTSPNSTAVYSEPELSKLLGYVKDTKHVGGNHGFSACVVGRPSALCPVERSSQFCQVA